MLARGLISALATVVLCCCGVAAAAGWQSNSTSHANSFTAAADFPPRVGLVPDAFGVAQAGTTLQAGAGGYSPAATSATYVWMRCDTGGGACVSAGSGPTYALGLADVGKTIRVQEAPVNGAAAGIVQRSEPTQVVRALSLGPVFSGAASASVPKLTGAASVGANLSSTDGNWSAPALNTISRQWLRCSALGADCVAIPGATAATYALVEADRGSRIRVRTTASAIGLLPNSALSSASALVT